MLGRKKESAGLPRREDGTPALPAEVVGDLVRTGRVSLGSWDEAEMRAAGFRTAAGEAGDASVPAYSPLQRLDAAAQERAVTGARAALLDRGDLAAPAPGQEPVLQGVLALAQEVRREYHLFGQYAASCPSADPAARNRTAYLVGVSTPDGLPALLEQALDPGSGRVELVLWSPGAFAAALVGAVFADHEELAAGVVSLHLVWSEGRQHRDVGLLLIHQRGTSFAAVEVTQAGRPPEKSGGTAAEAQTVLERLLDTALA